MDITTQLMDFRNRQHTINTSVELSGEGRRRAMQKLTSETAAARSAIVRDLQTQWNTWKADARRNIEDVRKAENEAAQKWDYARLEYMTRAIASTINNTREFSDVIGLYNQAKESGDLHARRAWAETAGPAVKAKYKGGEVETFTKQLAQDAAAAIETPQLKAAREAGAQLTERARILDTQTEAVKEFYRPTRGDLTDFLGDEFSAMRAGVSITQKVNPETLATETQAVLLED